MQKSYCYTPGVSVGVRVGVRVGVGVHMQNVRANVKVLEFKSFCIFSCILTLLVILIKPLTTKAYDRRASGDCGTSGLKSSCSDLLFSLSMCKANIIHWTHNLFQIKYLLHYSWELHRYITTIASRGAAGKPNAQQQHGYCCRGTVSVAMATICFICSLIFH